jgi:hypothetical protein
MILGQPKIILRLEGLMLFAVGLAAFLYLKQSVWIFDRLQGHLSRPYRLNNKIEKGALLESAPRVLD